jgi:ribosomal protein L19
MRIIFGSLVFVALFGCGEDDPTSLRDSRNYQEAEVESNHSDTVQIQDDLQEREHLERSLDTFAGVVVSESQKFLDDTPLVKLFIGETVTLKMSVHLKMLDQYEVSIESASGVPKGVISTRIQSILDSDPLGRKNVVMGTTDVPIECQFIDGVWQLKGDTLSDLITGLEETQGFNNPSDEFDARMQSYRRQIDSIINSP